MGRKKDPRGAMHVAKIRAVHGDKAYESVFIRRTFREDGKVKHETLANISRLPPTVIDLIRRSLQGETMVPVSEAFSVKDSRHHGHVQAVLAAMQRLGMANLLASRPSRERDLVIAMIVARILAPDSKLGNTRWWPTTTLPDEIGLGAVDVDELYAALDWLIERQDRIEKKLAARHLRDGGTVLYDLSSSYFEGLTCPLAAPGHNRDGKKGKLQVNYGLVTDDAGRPIAITLYPGNTGDSTTLLDHVQLVKERFAIKHMAIVGDRGMISGRQIKELRGQEGIHWITALKSPQIRKLVEGGAVQLGLFDQTNLYELSSPDYPGERLVACRNPLLARHRANKRRDLISATVEDLREVAKVVAAGHLQGQDKIGVRVGKVVDKHKVAKHFDLVIEEERFEFSVNEARVAAEAALDGIYIIRTNLPEDRLGPEASVRTYKLLTRVERAFRSLKTVDLNVRPIRHRLEDRVRAHFFVAMLAYYVEWHMRQAWKTLLFDDHDPTHYRDRDPVAPARRSEAALTKVQTRKLPDGTEVHTFQSLLQLLATIVRNTCHHPESEPEAVFQVVTSPSDKQQQAFHLLESIGV